MEWWQIVGTLGVGGFIGVLVTQVMTGRREAAARTVAFKKQQLEQFYGPLLSMRSEIRARSELRVKLQSAIDNSHVSDMLLAGPGRVETTSDPHIPAVLANVQDENQTFREVLMPRYRDMINTFREKMWLAEPETREFFPQLVEFVDVWDKILGEKLPRSVAVVIGHTEHNLTDFYRHIAEVHDRLRSEIK
jgi:hypothetical protein